MDNYKYKVETPTQVKINDDHSLKAKEFFFLENLVRRLEAMEDYLIHTLNENRKVMISLNYHKAILSPVAWEPEDVVQERTIVLEGLSKKDKDDFYKSIGYDS